MIRRILFSSALVAFGLALPASARAQDMGGPDAPKPDAPDAPKPDAPKPDAPKPDAPKPDAPKPADAPKADAKKTVSFDAPSSWTAGMGGKNGKAPKGGAAGGGAGPRGGHVYTIKAAEGDTDDAHAALVQPKNAKDFDGELTGWMKSFETADGKKLDKSAVKTDSVDTGAGTAKTAEMSGTFTMGGGRKKKGDDAAPAANKKPGYKTLAAYLTGPDGVWIARITGPEKTVEKAREDFMKWVKSAKVVDAAAAPAGADKPAEGKGDGE